MITLQTAKQKGSNNLAWIKYTESSTFQDEYSSLRSTCVVFRFY